MWLVTLGTAPGALERFAPSVSLHPPGAGQLEALIGVHERSLRDRYATRKLYDLLAGWRPPRRSPAWDRQTTVTAQLNELHPKTRPVRPVPVIRRRVA